MIRNLLLTILLALNLGAYALPMPNHVRRAATRTDEGYPFYGYLVYSSVDYYLGLYEIFPGDEYGFFFEDPGWEALEYDLVPYNGWYDNGKLNGISLYWYDAYTVGGYFTYSIDFETGELLDYQEDSDWYNREYLFDVCTLNPDDGLIYGYAFNPHGESWEYYWAYSTQEKPTDIHVIRPAEYSEKFVSICYREEDQLFYGMTSWMDFASIDTAGNIDYLFPAPAYSDAGFYPLQSGLIWSPEDEVFYWNAQLLHYNYEAIFSFLYSIDLDGEFNMIEQYSADQQFSFFVSPVSYFDPEAPMPPVINGFSFEGPSLTGEMTVGMPETFGDGSSLPETITYTALLDGADYSTGTAAPGEVISVEYTLEKPGYYNFGIYVSANGHDSRKVAAREIVGTDVPSPSSKVLLTPELVSWEAVTDGCNGGYVNADEMTYKVFLNGKELAIVSSLSYPLDLFAGDIEKYTASVVAISNGVDGVPAYSNTIVAGKPLQLPLSYEPTPEEFELMTVVNANEDSYLYEPGEITWTLTEHGLWSSGTEFSKYSMDDYVFLPPVDMTANTPYLITFEAGRYKNWYPDEYLNVVYASSPTAEGVEGYILEHYMPEVFLSETGWENWDNVSAVFSVPSSGPCYIGIQCVSDPMQYGVFIRNISLQANGDAGVDKVALSDNVSISTSAQTISIKGAEALEIMISSVDGKTIYKGIPGYGSVEINVSPGVYVVNIGRRSVKILVR